MECLKCGKAITEKVAEFSLKSHGKALCYDCQRIEPKKEWKKKETKSGKEFDVTSMLTSYAKDEVIAKLQYLPKTEMPQGEFMKVFWDEANQNILKSYQFFKEKLQGGANDIQKS